MSKWRARDPVMRFHNWLLAQGWWDTQQEQQLRRGLRKEVGRVTYSASGLLNGCTVGAGQHGWPRQSLAQQSVRQSSARLSYCLQVLIALEAAAKEPKPPLSDMFQDGEAASVLLHACSCRLES